MLYNQHLVGGLSVHWTPARHIHNLLLPGGSKPRESRSAYIHTESRSPSTLGSRALDRSATTASITDGLTFCGVGSGSARPPVRLWPAPGAEWMRFSTVFPPQVANKKSLRTEPTHASQDRTGHLSPARTESFLAPA